MAARFRTMSRSMKASRWKTGVFCGPSCVFTNVSNPRAFIDRRREIQFTHVGTGASIGANATIVCGANIGRYALIAAGAVVTRDVRPYALVMGSPARFRGWVGRSGERLDLQLVCPRTGNAIRSKTENWSPRLNGSFACAYYSRGRRVSLLRRICNRQEDRRRQG